MIRRICLQCLDEYWPSCSGSCLERWDFPKLQGLGVGSEISLHFSLGCRKRRTGVANGMQTDSLLVIKAHDFLV